MNLFRRSCCSILGVLLVFLLRGSCVDTEVVHKAVGGSLDLMANFSKDNLAVGWRYNNDLFAEYEKGQIREVKTPGLFDKRLKTYKDNISVTIQDLKLQDSGTFTIVATLQNNKQLPTKTIELHVHDLITNVQIDLLPSKNCTFVLQCRADGDPKPSYSWSGHQIRTGPHLNISLHPEKNATLTCTANNTVSAKSTTKTVVCSEKFEGLNEPSDFNQYLLIAVGVGIIAVIMSGATVAVCCKRRKQKGQPESEGGLTVYEDVNTAGPAKKRSESVVNGTSIYETVGDINIPKETPQTLYDKINYQRHPAVSANTSSPYQEVL